MLAVHPYTETPINMASEWHEATATIEQCILEPIHHNRMWCGMPYYLMG